MNEDRGGAGDRSAIEQARRVCFFAHYHHLGHAAPHVLHYLDALRDAGFATVVMSTATMTEAAAATLRAHCTELVFRENVGLDFGGWVDAWRRYPGLSAELLLLTNDSVYGPIDDLGAFIDRLTRSDADFYGAVESLTFAAHLQSWFLLLRPAAYRSAAFAALMARGAPIDQDKWGIIMDLELGFTRALAETGLSYDAAFRPARDTRLGVRFTCNPGHLLWRALIERFAVPFVKIELLRHNPVSVPDIDAIVPLVRSRNPALAAMIEEDRALRPGPHPPRGMRPWLESMMGPQWRGQWPELRGPLRRDAELDPKGLASRVNAAWASVPLRLGQAARVIVRRIGPRLGMVKQENRG